LNADVILAKSTACVVSATSASVFTYCWYCVSSEGYTDNGTAHIDQSRTRSHFSYSRLLRWDVQSPFRTDVSDYTTTVNTLGLQSRIPFLNPGIEKSIILGSRRD